MSKIDKHGVDFKIMPESCARIPALSSQIPAGKAIFGGGYLLSKKAAAEKAAAEKAAAEKAAAEKASATRWPLSEHERAVIAALK